MTPVIKWTLWQRRWSTVWWSLGAFGLIFINMIFYPTFRNQAEQLQRSFENLPKAATQLLGGSTDFFSPIGFLNSQIFFFMLPLILSILAIGLGSSLIAREEQDRTIEVLLAKPISRSRLILAKSLTGLLILSIVTIVGLLTTIGMTKLVDLDISTIAISLATLVCFLLVLSFGAIAFMVTALGRTKGLSLGVTALVAFGGYLVSSLAGTVSWLETPSKFFPFEFYQSDTILRGNYNWTNILFFILLILTCSILSWQSFRRRDIR